MVKLVKQPGIMLQEGAFAMKVAADKGYLHICKYLHEQGCARGTTVCYYAASGKHLHTLRWLRENECPWDFESLRRLAARDRSIEIMMYLKQQSEGAEWNAELLTDMLNKAGCYNQLEAAKWLRQQGAEWPNNADPTGGVRLLVRGEFWEGDTLQWARAEGCTTTL
jgi:hypothetical protein